MISEFELLFILILVCLFIASIILLVKVVRVKPEDEMDLMAACANLHRAFLPYREYVAALNVLAKKWLQTHKSLPNWW